MKIDVDMSPSLGYQDMATIATNDHPSNIKSHFVNVAILSLQSSCCLTYTHQISSWRWVAYFGGTHTHQGKSLAFSDVDFTTWFGFWTDKKRKYNLFWIQLNVTVILEVFHLQKQHIIPEKDEIYTIYTILNMCVYYLIYNNINRPSPWRTHDLTPHLLLRAGSGLDSSTPSVNRKRKLGYFPSLWHIVRWLSVPWVYTGERAAWIYAGADTASPDSGQESWGYTVGSYLEQRKCI